MKGKFKTFYYNKRDNLEMVWLQFLLLKDEFEGVWMEDYLIMYDLFECYMKVIEKKEETKENTINQLITEKITKKITEIEKEIVGEKNLDKIKFLKEKLDLVPENVNEIEDREFFEGIQNNKEKVMGQVDKIVSFDNYQKIMCKTEKKKENEVKIKLKKEFPRNNKKKCGIYKRKVQEGIE
jgi:hypothetical protein